MLKRVATRNEIKQFLEVLFSWIIFFETRLRGIGQENKKIQLWPLNDTWDWLRQMSFSREYLYFRFCSIHHLMGMGHNIAKVECYPKCRGAFSMLLLKESFIIICRDEFGRHSGLFGHNSTWNFGTSNIVYLGRPSRVSQLLSQHSGEGFHWILPFIPPSHLEELFSRGSTH